MQKHIILCMSVTMVMHPTYQPTGMCVAPGKYLFATIIVSYYKACSSLVKLEVQHLSVKIHAGQWSLVITLRSTFVGFPYQAK